MKDNTEVLRQCGNLLDPIAEALSLALDFPCNTGIEGDTWRPCGYIECPKEELRLFIDVDWKGKGHVSICWPKDIDGQHTSANYWGVLGYNERSPTVGFSTEKETFAPKQAGRVATRIVSDLLPFWQQARDKIKKRIENKLADRRHSLDLFDEVAKYAVHTKAFLTDMRKKVQKGERAQLKVGSLDIVIYEYGKMGLESRYTDIPENLLLQFIKLARKYHDTHPGKGD